MKPLLLLAALSCLSLAEERPNVLVILIDDMGWRDVGYAGNPFVESPRIDALAHNGMRFSQGYSSAPNCAPTRACLLTGQYTPRHGVYTVIDDRHAPGSPHQKILATDSKPELATEAKTLPECFRDGGHVTGMVGMWNLGRGVRGPCTPDGQGFTFSRQPKEMGFENDAYHDANGRDLNDAMAEEACQFIKSNAAKPWFLYFAPHAVHAPFDPDPKLLEKYRAKPQVPGKEFDPELAATVEGIDRSIGYILDTLKQLDLGKRTYILFTSDNGGTPPYLAPLKGGKGALYEGGIRVPLAISGPGIKPESTSDVPVLSMDLFPTALDLASAKPPAEVTLDGRSIKPLLLGNGPFQRDAVFWHFPCYTGRYGPGSAMRSGRYKLIEFFESQTFELYDLSADPGESTDIIARVPELSKSLQSKLRAWQDSISAPRPTTPNPAFDPNAERPRGRDERGKGNKGGKGGPNKHEPNSPEKP